jgi:2,3-bisphosphoglycerate-dependent phosphoglycerate mutase
MMRSLLLCTFLAFQISGFAQETITTFLLIRHAEKGDDGTKDPDLTEAGKQRSIQLVEMLKNQTIDAIYSTRFKRTQNTVAPLAESRKLKVSTYEASKPEDIDAILSQHKGGTVIICGHSNSIPWTTNYLVGKEQYKDFEDKDYKNLVVVNVVERGKVAKVTWLSY